MIVNKARPADLAGVMALEAEGFEATEAWTERAWAEEFEGGDRFVLIGRQGGEIMAAATYQLVADTADMHRILVAKKYRGQGLAAALITPGLTWAKHNGATRMMLEVRTDNEFAIRLYRRFGFVDIATRPNYYGPGLDALVMTRGLGDIE